MKTLKKGMFILLGLSIAAACSSDDDNNEVEASATTISNLNFEITSENDLGNMIGVRPSSTGGTAYSVDFGDPNAENDQDIILSAGPKVTYTYPEVSSAYDIVVTASSANAASVSFTKTHNIAFEAATVLADFEDAATLNLRDDTGGGASIIIEEQMGADGMTKVGAITNMAMDWEAISINNSKHVKVSGSKSNISIDFYQSEAAARNILLKLEGAKSTSEGVMPDVEVSVTTENITGWQTLEFDFTNNSINSYPNNENSTVILDQYQKMVFFVDAGSSVAGTFWIDNIEGAEFGDDIPDGDGDGTMDSIDECPDVAGLPDNDGCPATTSRDNAMDDFEGAGNVAWSPDGGTTFDAAISNPSNGGINTSNTVLKYNDNGDQYANIRFDLAADHSEKFDLTAKNIFKVKVFVPTPVVGVTQPLQLALKLQDGSEAEPWNGQKAVIQTYTYDTWQELTFDFSDVSAETKYSRIVVQFNGENNTEIVEAYIDDISQN